MTETCYCDYEPAAVYRRNARVARVARKCSECHRLIYPGERYEAIKGLWDGEWSSFSTCSRCGALEEWVRAHVPCLCTAHGHIIEDCLDAVDDVASEAPGLRFGALRRLVAIQRHR